MFLKNKNNRENMFCFQFFFYSEKPRKHKKTINLKNNEFFREQNGILYVFKKCSQEQFSKRKTKHTLRACWILVFENCFMFLHNKENKRTILVHSFFFFFFAEKHK